jgi:hypothetical protein
MTPMSTRLATVAPDLVPQLNSRPQGELRNLVAVVAREAVARTGLDDPLVASALDQIGTGEPGMNARVQEVAERLDHVAWDIQDAEDGHDSDRYMAAFRRARAASAVAFALDPDSGSMLESIYEAQAALGSIAAARQLIEPLLTND